MLKKIKAAFSLIKKLALNHKELNVWLSLSSEKTKALEYIRKYNVQKVDFDSNQEYKNEINPLWEYFQNNKQGNGIWKWEHYFDIYHTHFNKFVNKEVKILEIGIYSGGSLSMWKSYFGDNCKVFGIDIEESCKVYENDYTSIFTGDQEDRTFWKTFFNEVGSVDIVIDDGGHTTEQQRITFEETLQMINPGGVYLCEDVHRQGNRFAEYSASFIHELNKIKHNPKSQILDSDVSNFQSSIKSIHFYPYVFVVEKHKAPISKLRAPKHGTSWQPFFE